MQDDLNEEMEIPDWLKRPAEAAPAGREPEAAPSLEPGDVPDWLSDMRPGATPVAEEPPQDLAPDVFVPEEEPSGEQLLEELRAQAVEPEPEEEPDKQGTVRKLIDRLRGEALRTEIAAEPPAPRKGLAGALQGLAAWQRAVLALLLFLDVLLLGCMCLLMSGRVVPFP